MGTTGNLFYILLDGYADVLKPVQSKEPLPPLVGNEGEIQRDQKIGAAPSQSEAKKRVLAIARQQTIQFYSKLGNF